MDFEQTKLNGVSIVSPKLLEDERGYFTRIFGKDVLQEHGITFDIVQANRSLTKNKGMIRGMHRQLAPHAEDKLVSCLQGAIFDVALDMRDGSPTFGQWFGTILSAENKKMLLIPKGFAHGFQAQEENCLVQYFVTAYYEPTAEAGIKYDDPAFGIDWPIKEGIQTSQKDASWPLFRKD